MDNQNSPLDKKIITEDQIDLNDENQNLLNDGWTFWYHDPDEVDWSLNSYQKVFSFNTVETFWSLHKILKNEMLSSGMFFIMKNQIYPTWEDINNKNGGCWSFKILKKDAYKIWIQLAIYMISGNISPDIDLINGISISPKKGFCIIKIWNNDKNKCSINNICPSIPYISLEENIYKPFF